MKIQELVQIDFKKIPNEILLELYKEIHTEVSKRRHQKIMASSKINVLNKQIQNFNKKGKNDRNRFKLYEKVINDDWDSIYPESGGDNKYYVYFHIEPISKGKQPLDLSGNIVNGLPFYVGKGTGNRAYDLKRNEGHGARLRELLNMGISEKDIVVIFKDGLTESQAFCLEAKLIYFFGTKFNSSGGNLVNLTVPKTPYD